MARCHPDF